MLMAYPEAQLLRLTKGGLDMISVEETDHFRLMREFWSGPKEFVEGILEERGEDLRNANFASGTVIHRILSRGRKWRDEKTITSLMPSLQATSNTNTIWNIACHGRPDRDQTDADIRYTPAKAQKAENLDIISTGLNMDRSKLP